MDSPRPRKRVSVDQRVAQNLRVFRESREVSQAAVAKEMADRGWPYRQQTINSIERGVRKVSIGEAEALSWVLGVSLEQLISPTEEAEMIDQLVLCAYRAGGFYKQVVSLGGSLLLALGDLGALITETEGADSPHVQEAREEAIQARQLTLERAVEQATETAREEQAKEIEEQARTGYPGVIVRRRRLGTGHLTYGYRDGWA